MTGPENRREEHPDDAVPEPPQDSSAAQADQPTGEQQPRPAPRPSSPSAAAARRARRIGGRPAGTPRPDGEPEPPGPTEEAAEPEGPAPTQPVSVTKPTSVEPAPPVVAASAPAAGEDAELGPPEPRTVVITAVPAWLNWAPAAVLTAGALVMAVLLAVFSHGVWWGPDPKSVPQDKSAAAVREQVLAAAKTCVATTNTYKYTDLEGYESKALACTTGEFTSQLRDTIDKVIKVNAPRLKSSQTAQINRGGIEAVTSDGKQWTVLLFGQLSVTNTENKQPRTDPFAAEVRMNKVDGKWLMGGLTTVSSPLS
jgi:hypothetical protein